MQNHFTARALGLTQKDIRKLASNSIAASFLPVEKKQYWLTQIARFAVAT